MYLSSQQNSNNCSCIFKRFLNSFNKKIFLPISILYICMCILALLAPESTSKTFTTIRNLILSNFSWLILLAGSTAVLCAAWMALSPYNKMKLGGADERPEFSFFAWVSMLFCAGLGTGFVIFGVAEPLYHLHNAISVVDGGHTGKLTGVPETIRLSIVNWSLFGWSFYAVAGWAIGYAAYRHNKPLRTSSGLYGIVGEKCNDAWYSKIVDVLAGISTIGGVALMIGLGVASISYALFVLFGITLTPMGKLLTILALIIAYIISSVTGLSKGMLLLSESNIYIALGLMCFVLIVGPAPIVYLLNLMIESTGLYITGVPKTLFWTDAGHISPRAWLGEWFIFNMLWMVTYIPFMGGFIAKISRGRTMREFVVGTVLVPTLMTVLWFSVWGGTSCFIEINDILPLWDVVQKNPEQGLYELLRILPLGWWLCLMAFVCFCLFAITTADAASYSVAQQTALSMEAPCIIARVYWGCLIGITGVVFQVAGGFTAIKSLAIVMASPFALISFAYAASIIKMMRADYKLSQNSPEEEF